MVCFIAVGLVCALAQASVSPGLGAPQVHVGEIFTGTQASPTAQYVVLRMQGAWDTNPNNVAGYGLVALDASGSKAPLGYLWMHTNVAQAAPGAPVLIATLDAQLFFGITPDFVWRGPHLPREGALCVLRPTGGYDDCVLYGSKQPNGLTQLDPNVTNNPFNEFGGIALGAVAQRVGVSADSSQDFWLRHTPWPQNNAGDVGQVPRAVCGNGVIEGLEACDAGASCGVVGGNCTSVCTINPAGAGSVCGNGIVEPGESCDDFNSVDLDGCSSSCQWEYAPLAVQPICGNGRLESGEACDGGPANGQGTVPCNTSCQVVTNLVAQPFVCGNGAVESPLVLPFAPVRAEQCDLGASNGQAHSSCSAACQFVAASHTAAVCGNGSVEPGEECDDGQTGDGDGCSAQCLLEVAPYYACGNGVLEPSEACDHGALNGTTGDSCSAHCSIMPRPLAVAPTPAAAPQSAGSASAVDVEGPTSAGVRGGSCQAVDAAGWPLAALAMAHLRLRRGRRGTQTGHVL